MAKATLILGRDGMGEDATEADFNAWVAFACERIDERCGFEVDVDTRAMREVQTDRVSADTDDAKQTVRESLAVLWDEFCADASAWPKAEVVS